MSALRTLGLLLPILVLLGLSAANAQGPAEDAAAALDEAYDKAFEELFADPGNLDKSFRFAELAVRKGNFEAAISALERMLLLNPELPRVRLELGVLYFRLGSFQLARSYLTRVLDAEDVPDEVRGRVKVFLKEIDANLKRNRFAGSILVGVRHQTNANAGPSAPTVLAAGLQAALADQFTRQDDSNSFVVGSLRHTFDLLNQDGDVIESGATFFASEQREQKQLDIVFLEANTGPRFSILRSRFEGASIRPFVNASTVYLQDSHFMDSFGGGLNFVLPGNARSRYTVNAEGKRKIFHNDSDHPTATGQSGWEGTLSLGSLITMSDAFQVSLGLRGSAQTSKEKFNAYRQFQFTLGGTKLIPLGVLPDPMALNLGVTRGYKHFRSPNPAVDITRKRTDREWRLSVLGSVPVSPAVTVVGNFQRVVNSSNLPNFEFFNTVVSLGTSVRF